MGHPYAERLKHLIWFDFKSTVKRLIFQVLPPTIACNASPSLEVGAFVDKENLFNLFSQDLFKLN